MFPAPASDTEAASRDADLRHRIMLFGGLLAAGLIGFGLILWIAANWADMSRMMRFGIVGGAFALGCLAALAHPALRIPGALIAFCAIGGWFSLIGQVYQSGADPWQLFALWAVLALPLCLAARHDVLWVPWAVVALAGISLWMTGRAGVFLMPSNTVALAGWALAAAVSAGLALLDSHTRESRWAFRLTALLTIMMVTTTALGPAFSRNPGLSYLGLLVLAGAIFAFYRQRPMALGLMTMATLGLDTILIALVAHALLEKAGNADFIAFLVVGLIAAGIIGGSASLLLRLDRSAQAEARTWPVTILSGIGAVIAAIPLLAFLGIAFSELFTSPASLIVSGGILLGAALVLMRGTSGLSFRQQFSFIAMVVAFVLLAAGLYQSLGFRQVGLAMAGIYLATAVAAPSSWIRALLGYATAGALAFWLGVTFFGSPSLFMRTPAWLFLAIAAAAALYLTSPGRSRWSMLPPFFGGFAAAALTAMMVLAGQTFLLGGIVPMPHDSPSPAAFDTLPRAVGIAAALAGAGLMAWQGGPAFRTPLALVIAAILLAFSALTTPLGPAFLLLVVALLAGRTVIAGLGVVACLWIVGAFYYWLGWPLDQKAYLLVGMGALLALVTALSRDRHDKEGSTLAPATATGPALAAALIGLSAISTGGLAGKTILDKEAILRDGRRIFIALAPVDPRSLMQGDYMALRFALPQNSTGTRPTHALATLDARSIATVTQLVVSPPLAKPDEIHLLLKHKQDRPILGTDAWFFKEGKAKVYEAARFGEFRVGSDGEMILTGMADKDLNLLK